MSVGVLVGVTGLLAVVAVYFWLIRGQKADHKTDAHA
jgi:hypothetical protein